MLTAAIFMSEGQLQNSRRRCSDDLGLCYEFVYEQENQSYAAFDCRSRGGILAAIPNRRTQHNLQRLLEQDNVDSWIGGRLHFGGNWTWVDDTSYSQS